MMDRFVDEKLLKESILLGFIFFISYSGTIVYDNKNKHIFLLELRKFRILDIFAPLAHSLLAYLRYFK